VIRYIVGRRAEGLGFLLFYRGRRDTFADSECVVHLEAVGALTDVSAWPVDAVHQRAGAFVTALLALINI